MDNNDNGRGHRIGAPWLSIVATRYRTTGRGILGRRKTIEDAELLAHARRVFLEKGALGSTKEIAKSAAISEAVLFQRFPTKAALFLAAMVPPQVDADEVIRSGMKYSDPQDALCAICDSLLVYFRSMMPVVLHLLTHPTITLDDVMSHFEKSASATLPGALSNYLKSLHKSGKAYVKDPDSAAALLISSIHSLAIFEMLGAHGGHFPEAGVRALIGALWSGLQPRR